MFMLEACVSLTGWLGGVVHGQPEDLKALSPGARALVERAFAGLGDAPLEDYHAHIVGVGAGGTGAQVNPSLLSWWHPVNRFTTAIYLSASGAKGLEHFDQEYADRLARLAQGFGRPIRVHILALDHYYNPDGTVNYKNTIFYVPNDYVVKLAAQHPDLFVPVISVHPDRPDALAELDKWAAQGVRFMKWLPNSQGIDPATQRYDEFYRRLRQRGIVLLTHTGEEHAVGAAEQTLGNPLRLRRPLDLGVRVVMAHCASSGRTEDLDHPGARAENFDLFLRMMDEPRYRGLLFADISAVTLVNRTPGVLRELIRRSDLHDRLVNGSDYPLPAINCAIWTRKFVRLHMITTEERKGLNETYAVNPLLFDFVLKRTVRDPETGQGLPASLFTANPAFVTPDKGK
jgi:predicted TIM-barrel fold metal-dependent hydrolase